MTTIRFCSGNLFGTEKTVLPRLSDQNNRQRLHIPGLGNIIWPFFFEFSIVRVLKFNFTKLFLIYASLSYIRIFHRMYLLWYTPVNDTGISLFSMKNIYFISYEHSVGLLDCRTTVMSDYWSVGLLVRRTIGMLDNRSYSGAIHSITPKSLKRTKTVSH